MSEPTVRPIWTPDDYWQAVREAAKHAEPQNPNPDVPPASTFPEVAGSRDLFRACKCCGAWPDEQCEPGCLNLMTRRQAQRHRDDVLDRAIAEVDGYGAPPAADPACGWYLTDHLHAGIVESMHGRHRAAVGPRWTFYVKAAAAVLVLVMVLTTGALWLAGRANATPPNCHQQPWLYGGLFGRMTTRTLCDGPIRADGSWLRHRNFYSASYYKPISCSWSYGSGSCSGGYQVAEFDTGVDEYVVTIETVLADEPGHLG